MGGHNAHDLYFKNLAPVNNGGGVLPDRNSMLIKEIENTWGSFETF